MTKLIHSIVPWTTALVLIACGLDIVGAAAPDDPSMDGGNRDAGAGSGGVDGAGTTAPGSEGGSSARDGTVPSGPHDCTAAGACERVVFATAVDRTGNLGGLAGADNACKTEAEEGTERVRGRTYVAWLSDEQTPASARLHHDVGPYVLPTGVRVATNWTVLTSGTLERPIDETSAGTKIGDGEGEKVWTGTLPDGGRSVSSCTGWSTTQGVGTVGLTDKTSREWTVHLTDEPCQDDKRLYCIEQR